MLIDFILGQTSIIIRLKVRQDNTGTKPGQGFTTLTNTSTGLIVAAIADVEATTTAYTSAASHVQTIATLGTFAAPTSGDCRLAAVDTTNHPGLMELQLDNTRYAVSNAKSLLISITGVSGMADCDVMIPLRTVNPYSSSFGLSLAKTTNITGFNDIAATAIVSSGAITTSGGAVSNVTTAATTTNLTNLPAIPANWLTATGIAASAMNGKGDWLLASSYTAAPTAAANATAVWQDTTAGDFTVASSVGKSLYTSGVVPGAAGGLFIAGTNAATTVTTSFTTTFTGNLTGSVGSVTGSVGSVTGAVGSVTGAVGSISGITFPTHFSALGITVGGAISEVSLVDTLTTYTGNTPQTADVGSLIPETIVMTSGKPWSLDSSGNALAPAATALSTAQWTSTRAGYLDNLNVGGNVASHADTTTLGSGLSTIIADVTALGTPMQAYAQPAGFLAATFPASVASPTNITAGTITTATNLTNLPAAPTNWLTGAAVEADAVTKIQSGLATASQIPANFTTATFASAGVFSTGALQNAPTGGGGNVTVAGYASGQDPATILFASFIEAGVTFLMALRAIASASAGQMGGADDYTTSTLAAIGNPGTPRIASDNTATTRTTTLTLT